MSTTMKKEFAKAKKVLHPNSRKSLSIAKKTKRIFNREKTKLSGAIKQNLIGEKMLWIRDHMITDVTPYTPELVAELLEKYISRHNEELEQIAIKRSVGSKRSRQHASREDVLRMTKERETEEFNTCGIEIPDILTSTQCDALRGWNGELCSLPIFKFRRFGRKHLEEWLRKKNKTKESTTKISPTPHQTSHREGKGSVDDREALEGARCELKENMEME